MQGELTELCCEDRRFKERIERLEAGQAEARAREEHRKHLSERERQAKQEEELVS